MILLLIQVGQLAKLDIQTQLKLSQRDLSNGLSYLIAEDLMVRFPLLMSQEKILLGLLAKSDLPMQKEFELKSKIFWLFYYINDKSNFYCFNHIDTKLFI
jgi:hypothetical protein